MKALLFFFALSFSISCLGQQKQMSEHTDSVKIMMNKKLADGKNLMISDEIYYTKACIGKYYKTRQVGTLFGVVCLSAGAAFALSDGQKTETIIIGGTFGLASIITYMSAEKWLKRASLKPSEAGFGLKFEF